MGRGERSFGTSVGQGARALALASAALVAGGCASGMDPQQARAEFSSKERSMTAGAAPAVAPNLAPGGPVTLAAEGVQPLPADPTLLADVAVAKDEAESILSAAARSSWAKLRANAIEMSARSPGLLERFAPAGLADENRGVRFVTAMAIARAPSRDLGALVTPLLADESDSVRAAAMLALVRCGLPCDPSPIGAMLASNDPEVRGNAYLVLGELGNPSAVPMIRESIGKGMKLVNPVRVKLVDLAAAEALVKLGDEHEIEPIRAALFAPPEQSELTAVACDAIGRLKDEAARPMLERLVSADRRQMRSPEIRLSAAKALVQLGSAGDRSLARSALSIADEYASNRDPRVRALVAALVAEIRSAEAVMLLSRLVRDSDPTVQVAAAGGLERVDGVEGVD